MAEPTTIIGEFTSVCGNLQGDEDLEVFGRVEGTIQLDRTLVVEPSGVVKADVTVRNAVISGAVVGNVEATESVHITTEGRMVGDISAPRVIIVEGALFKGRVDMGEAEPDRREGEGEPEKTKRIFPKRTSTRASSARGASPTARSPSPTARTPSRKITRTVRSAEPKRPENHKSEKKEAPEPQKPAPSRRTIRASEDHKAPKDEAKKDVEAKEVKAAADPPPPKPRVSPKKRRVSVRKKR